MYYITLHYGILYYGYEWILIEVEEHESVVNKFNSFNSFILCCWNHGLWCCGCFLLLFFTKFGFILLSASITFTIATSDDVGDSGGRILGLFTSLAAVRQTFA